MFEYSKVGGDIETGLYPGIGSDENQMRWGFIHKVYGIVSAQLLVTAAVASYIVYSTSAQQAILGSPGLAITLGLAPLGILVLLYCFSERHPLNLFLLGLFTATLSVSVGLTCATTKGDIVFEALLLTATVVVVLTLYTFWAAKQGHDFSFLAPLLLVGICVLLFWSIIQMFFPMGPVGRTIYALVGALIFSGYIVFDTESLIKRFTYDQYIMASVALYLDIVNLFMYILQIMRDRS